MTHQLYMHGDIRKHIIERHNFYVAQVKKRLFSQFVDLETEAETHSNEVYENLGQRYAEDDDGGWCAEAAHDAGIDHYLMLSALHQQIILGAVAGMYHQWDKELREFIIREMRHTCTKESIELIWKEDIGAVYAFLEEFGWQCKTMAFFPDLDACRLIVNIYKHGNGKSLNDLSKKYPQYLTGYKLKEKNSPFPEYLNHEMRTITEEQFEQLSRSILAFWGAFPERSYLPTQKLTD